MLHSWEVLAKILGSEEIEGVVCDIGMCVHSTYTLSRPLIVLQAHIPQECELQLPSLHSQQENSTHPSEDVAGKRWKLPRAPLLRPLDKA